MYIMASALNFQGNSVVIVSQNGKSISYGEHKLFQGRPKHTCPSLVTQSFHFVQTGTSIPQALIYHKCKFSILITSPELGKNEYGSNQDGFCVLATLYSEGPYDLRHFMHAGKTGEGTAQQNFRITF